MGIQEMAGGLRRKVATSVKDHAGPMGGDVETRLVELRRRVDELEIEVQEGRRLNRRLAELTDVVEELLLPVAQRDDEVLRTRLKQYADTL